MAKLSSSNGLEKRPKLRFPGFDEPWKTNIFDEIFFRFFQTIRCRGQTLPLAVIS